MTTEELAQAHALLTQLVETLNTTLDRHDLGAHVIVQACGRFVSEVFAQQSFPAEVPRKRREQWLEFFLAQVGEQVRDLWKPYDA